MNKRLPTFAAERHSRSTAAIFCAVSARASRCRRLNRLRPHGCSPRTAAGKLAGARPPARRSAHGFVYFPNGAIPTAWWPQGTGTDFEFSRTLQPLDASPPAYPGPRRLDHRNATAGPDGAGDHARANGTFLTGVRMKKSATDIHAGISIDQVIAQQIGHLTRFPSLELTCDSERHDRAHAIPVIPAPISTISPGVRRPRR